MRNYIILLLLSLPIFSSELIAQNLNLEIFGSNLDETNIISEFDYNKNHIDYNSITSEIDSLHQKIIKAGYIESEQVSNKKINDSSFQVKFQLNNKYEFIEIHYNTFVIDKKNIDVLTKDSFDGFFKTNFTDIETVLDKLNSNIANDGKPFSEIKLSEIKIKDKKTLSANLDISKNKTKRSLDKIVIKGYEKFPKSYLKRFLKIKPNKSFNIESIKNKLNDLDNLRFAEQIKTPEVLFTKDSTTLYIYLKKTLSNNFDGFLGFSTNEETNTLDFNGYLNLELNNNLNFGESFKLLYKSNESEEKNFEANLNLPYLFNSPVGVEVGLNIFKKDSSFTNVSQNAKIFYQINSKNKIFTGIESTTSNNLLDDEQTFFVDDYKTSLYTAKYIFENRNKNRLFRYKTFLNLDFGFGSRDFNNNTTKQTRIYFDGNHIFKLNTNNSFFLRLNGASLNSETFLENELFRFGGINSIRGFLENSLVANRFGVVNTEYRYLLSPSIYAHTIIDFGSFENKLNNINENLYGFGFGFGIFTKAGLLKFNFANGKTANQSFKFSNSKIHLSLISVF